MIDEWMDDQTTSTLTLFKSCYFPPPGEITLSSHTHNQIKLNQFNLTKPGIWFSEKLTPSIGKSIEMYIDVDK